jgi:hypothetical protein
MELKGRQADQTSKALGLRIVRILGETFIVNRNQVSLVLGAFGVNP